MRSFLVSVLLCVVGSTLVNSHGYMKEPLARTSIQLREAEFGTSQPYWWDNHGVWCGNVQQDVNFSNCGRCGDQNGQTTANQNGIYDKKVIVANYSSGAVINVVADFGAPHAGQFHIDLCSQESESDGCFQRLNIVSSSTSVENNKACVDNQSSITARVQLPSGVRCNRCTLRWTYRTHYPGQPYDPNYYPCKLNTYPAQTFRNCADIRIN